MNELDIYDKGGLFNKIVEALPDNIFNGRYAALEKHTNEINQNNLISILDEVKEKYPLVACMPPASSVNGPVKNGSWELFNFRLLFLCNDKYTGDNQLINRDHLTNTSLTRSNTDVFDMKYQSSIFLAALEEVLEKGSAPGGGRMINQFRIAQNSNYRFTRIVRQGTERLSGVMVDFQGQLLIKCVNASFAGSIIISERDYQPLKH